MSAYEDFLASKTRQPTANGIDIDDLPLSLFPHQSSVVRWAGRQGRAAAFLDTGLGKTRIQLAWLDAMRQGGRGLAGRASVETCDSLLWRARDGCGMGIGRRVTGTFPGAHDVVEHSVNAHIGGHRLKMSADRGAFKSGSGLGCLRFYRYGGVGACARHTGAVAANFGTGAGDDHGIFSSRYGLLRDYANTTLD